jgi:hypothetical protein
LPLLDAFRSGGEIVLSLDSARDDKRHSDGRALSSWT